jgi:hypothetical protein
MTAHEPNPDQRRTEARNKPAKPPEGGSPLGRLDAEAIESQRAHERDLASRGARPVEDREPGMPVYPPFGQSGVPLVDDNGAPFPEETQQLFREVAQDAYLRGIRDQREREQAGKRRKCTSGHYLTDEGAHGEGQTWCGAGPEPVGPYAPTRTGVPLSLAESLGSRLDGLVDAVLRQEQRLTEHLRLISTKVDFLNQVDASEGDEPLLTQSAANAYGEREFERGRQQGDADRAQRELATDEEMNAPISDQAQKNVREALKSAEEHRHRGYEAGFSGGKIVGAAEREAELLDQGWTPPGATSVDARLLDIVNSDYPTEYEVWRDAVSIAGAQRDRRPPAKDLADRLTADAEWFWGLLQEVPVLKFDDSATDLGGVGDGTTFGTNPDDD